MPPHSASPASVLRSCALPAAVVSSCILAAAWIGRAAAARAIGAVAGSSQGDGDGGSSPRASGGGGSGGGRTVSEVGDEFEAFCSAKTEDAELLELRQAALGRDAEPGLCAAPAGRCPCHARVRLRGLRRLCSPQRAASFHHTGLATCRPSGAVVAFKTLREEGARWRVDQGAPLDPGRQAASGGLELDGWEVVIREPAIQARWGWKDGPEACMAWLGLGAIRQGGPAGGRGQQPRLHAVPASLPPALL